MTHQTNEELREKIGVVLDNYRDAIRHGVMFIDNPYLEVIMSLISQSESKETDSNEVKELVEIMVKEHDNLTNDPRTRKTAQAILQAGYTKNKGTDLQITQKVLDRILIRESNVNAIEHIEYVLKIIEFIPIAELVESKRNTNFDIKEPFREVE